MKNLLKSVLLLVALSFAFTTINAQTGKIVFDNPSHDFGSNIPEKGGNVTHRFTFTNKGDAPVTIQNVTASCGCTTPAWTKEPVAPGAQGFVDATYRPAGRAYPFKKNLNVTSNGDPKFISLTISGVVVKEPLTVEEEFPVSWDGIRLSEKAFAFSRVIITEKESKPSEIKVYNSSDIPVELSFKNVPDYLKIQPVKLQPKEKGVIKATYGQTKNAKYGTSISEIEIFVNGKKLPETLTATITLIPVTSGDENTAKPVLNFLNNNYMFNNIKQGSMVSNEYRFKNAGQADLNILAVNAINYSGDNLKITYPKAVKPGEEGVIKVVLNTKKLKGQQDFNIEIITNVSSSPVSHVALRGNIVE
ncbi:MAG: DUF1573 domain-containing protein [Prevotellaceae bacterium]|jgi:hypothetical protein|nr:DUF1573 domain-containing protein [Prevotellaceae bacterium]